MLLLVLTCSAYIAIQIIKELKITIGIMRKHAIKVVLFVSAKFEFLSLYINWLSLWVNGE